MSTGCKFQWRKKQRTKKKKWVCPFLASGKILKIFTCNRMFFSRKYMESKVLRCSYQNWTKDKLLKMLKVQCLCFKA